MELWQQYLWDLFKISTLTCSEQTTMFSFNRYCKIVFQSVCTSLHLLLCILANTWYYPLFFWQVCGGIPLWFKLAFPWWLLAYSTFSHVFITHLDILYMKYQFESLGFLFLSHVNYSYWFLGYSLTLWNKMLSVIPQLAIQLIRLATYMSSYITGSCKILSFLFYHLGKR